MSFHLPCRSRSGSAVPTHPAVMRGARAADTRCAYSAAAGACRRRIRSEAWRSGESEEGGQMSTPQDLAFLLREQAWDRFNDFKAEHGQGSTGDPLAEDDRL